MDGGPAKAIHLRLRRRGGLEVAATKTRRRAKKHRNYTVAEAARLFGVHRNTVRHWIKTGLPVVHAGGLVLILGEELERFQSDRKAHRRRPCPPGAIYCLKCREPRLPVPDSLGHTAANGRTVLVTGICSTCGTGLNRRTRLSDLPVWTPSAPPLERAPVPVVASDVVARANASSAPSR